jgi:hypothetical protein
MINNNTKNMKPNILLKGLVFLILFCSSLNLTSQIKGKIEIISNPEGAEVFINKESTQKVTPLSLELVPGVYELKMEKNKIYNLLWRIEYFGRR